VAEDNRNSAGMNIEPSKRRTVARQRNHANPPVEIEAHYRVAYFYAFLDHTVILKTRFPRELEGALLATLLLPSNEKLISYSG